MFIDTHCHLTDELCDAGELDAIVARAANAGVGALICPGADAADAAKQIEIINKYEKVFATLGIHPERANQNADVGAILPDDLFAHPKVLGVGEIGLDYHYGAEFKKQQIELFERQLDLAQRHHLPVAIHTRDADEDTARILDDAGVGGVMHCFTGSWDFAKKMLDRGFFFSAGGILTFKNAAELRDVFAKIPNDRIVIETDSPYLAPVPYRGKKCEPFMVVETAITMAGIKKLRLDQMEDILMQNTKKLYPRIKL
ncbi:MAG: TatD family hydrolase [Rickettsiales bacterium]|jgi:TatD DNase family protein|nr:TatD family hydrolase [Rickettsiales bacterium]